MNKTLVFVLSMVGWISACTTGSNAGRSVKFDQYFVEGEQLYIMHCSNCHQQSGEGLGLLYPPLNRSDYMDENLEEVICLIKNGKQGELLVNGNTYNQPMPGIATLTDLEIAEIATYIYNNWEHNKGIIDLKLVTKTLKACNQMEASP